MSRRRQAIELPAEAPTSEMYVEQEPDTKTKAVRDQRASVRDFLLLSKKRFQTADASSNKFRGEMRRDQRFAAGGGYQWEAEDRQARMEEGRPCLEINRIPQFIRQVSNQNRANRSQIQINPRGKDATVKLAAAIQGLVRSVEVESDADVAYDTATEHQLRSGIGFVRLIAAWAGDDSFDTVCRIKRVRNPLSVYWDPSTQEADFYDMRWLHIVGVIGKDEYESRWGTAPPYTGMGEYLGGEDQSGDWMPEGRIFIFEYYYVQVEERDLYRMAGGENVWAENLEKFQAEYLLAHPEDPEGAEPITSRKVKKRVVYWCFHNGLEILEGNDDKTAGRELPGSRIPVFPVIGDELDIDGDIDYRGMVRDARDPQRMYNFWASSIAEAVGLAPKAPWIAAKGQIDAYIDDWKDANRKAKAYLPYDPKSVDGNLVPPPQRNAVEPAIQAMVQGLTEADRDLKSVMGLFEPSLGERSRQESGKAIEAMQAQGNVANSNYLDNLQRTKRSIGRSLIEWIPVTYDTARIHHLLTPDGKRKAAVIYAGAENKPAEGEFGDITEMYDVGVGHFDITVSTGPSFQTERQATEAWLLELFKVLPGLAAIGADIVLENSDNPAAQALAARAKKAMDPRLMDDKDPAMQVPMLEAKLQQSESLLDKAHTAIQLMAKTIETKVLDQETKLQVATISANASMAIAAAKLGGDKDKIALEAALANYQMVMEQINAQTMQGAQHGHEADQQARQSAADAQAQQSDQGAAAQMQTSQQGHEAEMTAAQLAASQKDTADA